MTKMNKRLPNQIHKQGKDPLNIEKIIKTNTNEHN